MHMINRAVGGIVFERQRDQTISLILYNLLLDLKQTRKISLAGFSN